VSTRTGASFRYVRHFSPDMRDQNASRQLAVAEIAARQHGVVCHRQLIELGLSGSAIHGWVRSGRLHRLHRGVYAVGHSVMTAHGRWMAAVLACGPSAVLSHRPAAALWDLRRLSTGLVEVTTPGRQSPRGIRAHRVRRLHPDDCTIRDGIPVTTVARTVLDLAETLTPRELVRVLEQAERLQIFDLNAIHAAMARNPGRHGAKPLRQALAQMTPDPPRINSAWERDLLDFCDDHGIPKPELNVMVEGYEVDALWADKKLVVELDSYAFHRSRRAFEQDRRRYAKLQLADHLVLPFTELDGEAAELLTAAVAAR
jgi:hypothetical protein